MIVYELFDFLTSSMNFSRVLKILDIVFARRALYFGFLCIGMNNLIMLFGMKLTAELTHGAFAERAKVRKSRLSEA